MAASAIMLSACTPAATVATPVDPSLTTPSADSDVMRLAESGDSAGLAKLIRSSCASVGTDRAACYEHHLAHAASAGHVKVAMGALDLMGAADSILRRNGHVYAHAIGIAAGENRADIATTFTQCSESFQSGCYHGIIQAWFAGLDSVSAADVNALCSPFRRAESSRWIRFQCVHGMGHGLTMLYDHDLPRALTGCDLLTEWWDRHSCYSGAFMENIVNVTMPHHPASSLAHHGRESSDMADMPGMDHRGTAAAFKPVNPADPQYPCSVLPERYLAACYEMQTSVMLYNNKGDIAAAAHSCDSAPAAFIITCYASLGRDISSYSAQNHAQAVRMCSLGNPRYQPWCYYGLVKNFIDLNARAADGLALCRSVTTESGKLVCYEAVGEQVALLSPSADERRATCSPAEPAYLDACLYGARVATSAPAALVELWQSVKKN